MQRINQQPQKDMAPAGTVLGKSAFLTIKLWECMSITLLLFFFLQRMLLSGEEDFGIPALLRVRMWLGRLADSPEFMKCCEGRILVFAETVRKSGQFHPRQQKKKSNGPCPWGGQGSNPHFLAVNPVRWIGL